MNKKSSIGFVGQGFVGGSFTTGMSHAFDVYVYDKAGKVAEGGIAEFTDNKGFRYRPENITQFVTACESEKNFLGIFGVAVPTPMYEDGECDIRIVESVLMEIAKTPVTNRARTTPRIVMVKSTVPPGSVERWNKMFNEYGLEVIHNPEFLTERNALEDFKNQDRIVLGGPKKAVNRAKAMYQMAYPKVPVLKTSSSNSEMIKYVINTFLATKVSFANEIYQICSKLSESGVDIDYDRIIEIATVDKRLGTSHWRVPSFETDEEGNQLFGYSLSCFPKDINSLMNIARKNDVDPKVLDAGWRKNIEVRPGQDWKKLEGRAVSKREKSK